MAAFRAGLGALFVTMACMAASPEPRECLLSFDFSEGNGSMTRSAFADLAGTIYGTNGATSSEYWGNPSVGISEIRNDFHFETLSASGMGSGHRGPHVAVTMPAVPALSNLTVTGWFLSSVEDLGRATLLIFEKTGAIISLKGISGGRLHFSFLNNTRLISGTSGFETNFSTPGRWAFFAVVYQCAPVNRLTFYHGTQNEPVMLSADETLFSSPPVDISVAALHMGSDPDFSNPFQGRLDNISIFTTALTAGTIEQVRLRGLMPERLQISRAVGLTWPTRAGRVYRLEGSHDFATWTDVITITGDGQDRSHDIQPDASPTFYRLRMTDPQP